ncbi:BSD domain containing 1 [Nesidiocoris tenuis]|uniref:BSD domain containing 1 n=1 Tax=Nesidiocoris tenuis TaxID=355587 RepID=A0ABN7B7L3_9HEMI|nr:BSD domain containing 1 [Nesidiocoris tenuis]
MAEGNWWNSWVTSAKNKSVEVLEFVKKDIEEISTAVKAEASLIAKDVKETLQLDKEDSTANTVKKSLSSFFEGLSEVLVPPVEDDTSYVPVIVKDGEPVQLTPLQLKFHQLISSSSTFTEDIPADQKEQFVAWIEVSQDSLTNVDRLTTRLANNPILHDKYTTLVPEQVSHSEFWARYLFRRALLEDSEAEEERKRKKSETEKVIEGEAAVDENAQEAHDDSGDNKLNEKDFGPEVELTEEEQIRLLSLYEEERKAASNANKAANPQTTTGKDLKVRERNDIVIVDSHTPSASTSSKDSSTDGDWEKDFEVDDDKN